MNVGTLTPDMVNGAFEFFGACFATLNVRAIYKAKKIAGVHWSLVAFHILWGFWNLYFFPSQELWYSFLGGLFIVVVNSTWLWLVFYYRYFASKLGHAG